MAGFIKKQKQLVLSRDEQKQKNMDRKSIRIVVIFRYTKYRGVKNQNKDGVRINYTEEKVAMVFKAI